MGLLDYLTDRRAKSLTRRLYDMLAPGGLLIIGNMNETPMSNLWPMEFIADWTLYYRDDPQMLAWADGLDTARAWTETDPTERVRMLYQHFAHEPLGVWETIREDARGLYVKGRLVLDVTRAREVRSLLRDGALNGLSIGFRTVRATRGASHRILNEIELWEISVVTFPLLAGSKVTAIGAKGGEIVRTLRQASAALRA